jgi:hypothetical protein
VIVPWMFLTHWATWGHLSVLGRWVFIERYDLQCYFAAAQGAANGHGVFAALRNEYPFAANLVFDAVGALSRAWHPLADPFESFVWLWLSVMWWVYLGVFALLRRHGNGLAWLLWLTPAALHFTLMRFDALPMLATLLALLALRKDRIFVASLWLGLAIALKAYAVVLLPCYGVYVLARRSWYRAALECGLVLAPFALAHGIVFVFAGREVMEAPYRMLALHHLNGESAWDALHLLTGADTQAFLKAMPAVPKYLVLLAGVVPALSWPATFEAFTEAGGAALLASILFLDFQSPQYVLWALPFVAFSNSRREQVLFLVHSLAVYFYFPVAFSMRLRHAAVWHASIIAAHATRVAVMAAALGMAFGRPRRTQAPLPPEVSV